MVRICQKMSISSSTCPHGLSTRLLHLLPLGIVPFFYFFMSLTASSFVACCVAVGCLRGLPPWAALRGLPPWAASTVQAKKTRCSYTKRGAPVDWPSHCVY